MPPGSRAPRKKKIVPLEWVESSDIDIGVEGKLPDCAYCCNYLFRPHVVEAIYSVAIDSPLDAVEIAIGAVNWYHNNGHRENMI